VEALQFEKQLKTFISENSRLRPEFENRYYRYPCLSDDTSATFFDEHYVYHTAWALRKTLAQRPTFHVDFSSSLYFVTALASQVDVMFVDIRPPVIHVPRLTCVQENLSRLPSGFGQFSSVSCMHVVEHIGLGRYGDDLDTMGDIKAIECLKNTVAPEGNLYFVVPIGQPSIQFNAHRVYAPEHVWNWFNQSFDLIEFYFIPGNNKEPPRLMRNFEGIDAYRYGCGCFHFTKKSAL
jgi:hypothetical protein